MSKIDYRRYGISKQQRDFAENYIESGKIRDAALKAGYSKSYASSQAYMFLDHPKIGAYIQERMDEHAAKGIANQEEILNTLTNIIRGKEEGTGLVGIGPGKQAVKSMKPTVAEKTRAAELLGRRFLMWTDKQIIQDVKPTIINDVPEED